MCFHKINFSFIDVALICVPLIAICVTPWFMFQRNLDNMAQSLLTNLAKILKLFFQDVNQVIADDKLMYKVRTLQGIKSWFHLGQLQWLGLPYKQRFNMTYIREYINYIVDKYVIQLLFCKQQIYTYIFLFTLINEIAFNYLIANFKCLQKLQSLLVRGNNY